VTDAHQFLSGLAVIATVSVLGAIGWSAWTRRASSGAADRRFAVDRLILLTIGVVAVNGLIGLVLLGTGARPADPLHLLYGPAALVCLPVGIWLGRRGPDGAGSVSRRREIWLATAAVVLVGIELRLVMTG
jgi:hypothetical protein